MKPILIAGAGPGGLVAALGMQHRGIAVEVLERSPELRTAGAGVVLAVNAMRILHGLGVGDTLEGLGSVFRSGRVETVAGGVLQDFAIETLSERFGHVSIGIHRGDLAQTLADALTPGTLRFDAQVTSVDQNDNGVEVTLADGTTVEGAALIGADGIHSVVREALWGASALRYSGQTCWRGVAGIADPLGPGVMMERWAGARRFGIVPIGPDRTYWFATENTAEGGKDGADALAEARVRFEPLGQGIPELLAETGTVIRNDLHDLPALPRWTRGRITLLGDAAHAMTPNLGQGACQAIEDGAWLAHALDNESDIPTALASYEASRRTRVDGIVNRSRYVGQVATLENPVLCWIRDRVFSLTPQFVMEKGLDDLYGQLPP